MARFNEISIANQLRVIQMHHKNTGSHTDTIWRVLTQMNPHVIAGDVTAEEAKRLKESAKEIDSRREDLEKIDFKVSKEDTNIEGNY